MMRQMKHYKWTALCLVLLLTLSCFLTSCSDSVGSPATEPESTQAQQKQEAENDDGADKDGEACRTRATKALRGQRSSVYCALPVTLSNASIRVRLQPMCMTVLLSVEWGKNLCVMFKIIIYYKI